MDKRLLTALLAASLVTGLLSACGPFGSPKAQVEYNDLMVTVKNLDKNAWSDCRFIINAEAGENNQYVFEAGDVPGLDTKTVLLPQFSQAGGKRFMPLLTKATDFRIQCKSPMLPFKQSL